MRGKSMNRMVWAGGFTNDKTAHINKEPYRKKCDRCLKPVWISPDKNGWRVLNLDGTKHLCIVKKKKGKSEKINGVNEIRIDCKFCGVPIVLIELSGSGTKKYKAFDPLPPRTFHKCDRITRSAYKRESEAGKS